MVTLLSCLPRVALVLQAATYSRVAGWSWTHLRARWYDSSVGRWISEDPLGFEAGDGNVSRYVGNGVVNLWDPSGLEEDDIDDPNVVVSIDPRFPIGSERPENTPLPVYNGARVDGDATALVSMRLLSKVVQGDDGLFRSDFQIVFVIQTAVDRNLQPVEGRTFEGTVGHEQMHLRRLEFAITRVLKSLMEETMSGVETQGYATPEAAERRRLEIDRFWEGQPGKQNGQKHRVWERIKPWANHLGDREGSQGTLPPGVGQPPRPPRQGDEPWEPYVTIPSPPTLPQVPPQQGGSWWTPWEDRINFPRNRRR